MSLDQWCAEFQRKGYAIERKLDHEPSGKVTQSELRYCRQDVKVTQQLPNAAKQEFLFSVRIQAGTSCNLTKHIVFEDYQRGSRGCRGWPR
jgi:hypothetical protein